jgi:quercetin dioxygenase-like cupin family protein
MTGPATLPAVVRAAGDGQQRWFYGGGVHTWLATEEETGGAFLLFEDAMDAGKRTPLHTHPEADETMYVLRGEILMHLDGVDERIGAGGMVMAPRGLPHAFLVTADDTRLLCLQTPGCCQAFYLGRASRSRRTRAAPWTSTASARRARPTAASRSWVPHRSRRSDGGSPPHG